MKSCAKTKTVSWIALLLVAGVGCGPSYVKDTERFASRVKSVTKPDELQAWATNLIAKTTITSSTPVEVNQADIPNSLRTLSEGPPFAFIEGATGSKPAYVAIAYG